MHWDPTTNSRYIGTPISEEDAKYIAPLNGTPAKTIIANNSAVTDSLNGVTGQINIVYYVPNSNYHGIITRIKPGTCEITGGSGIYQHCITTHVYEDWAQTHWVEVGVWRSNADGGNWHVFTYDWKVNSNPILFDQILIPSQDNFNDYQIYVSTTRETNGYPYYVYISGRWAQTGYLSSCNCKIDEADEAWNSGYTWPHENSKAEFTDERLNQGTFTPWWSSSVGYRWNAAPLVWCPMSCTQDTSGAGGSYHYSIWIN